MSGSPLSDRVRIVLIHGMASKPAEHVWFDLCRQALLANLVMEADTLGARLENDKALMIPAYWADAIPDHLPDPPDKVRQTRRSITDLMAVRRRYGARLHTPREGWTAARIRLFGKDVIDALRATITIAAETFAQHRWELERYHTDTTIADRIRRPLENRLRECWDAGRRVILVSHSLGSAVAYDALWRFSHRNEPEFRKYRRKKVELLITMGAPLANRIIQTVMLSGRWLAERDAPTLTRRRRAWVTNVRRWENYSALGDYVCHGLDMDKEFFNGMLRDLPHLKRGEMRDYRELFNPYRESDGTPNPHKLFGYLIQPKLASRLCRLLREIDLE
jgi:hypothetical protein